MSESITGSCLCGAIKYQATTDPVWAHNCHCSRCRSASGAAFASTLFVPKDSFEFTVGEELLTRYEVPEAQTFNHSFCSTCGATLPFQTLFPEIIGIPMGSLDSDPGISPLAHIFVSSKASWFEITDSLTQNDEGFER